MISMSILSNLSIYLFESGLLDAPTLQDGTLTREQIIIRTLSTLSYSNYLLIGFVLFVLSSYAQPMIQHLTFLPQHP